MIGTCALSGLEAELQMSHIYPKFAIKYLRNTSNNGRFRGLANVNIVRQDGMKKYLLSRESEQRFSAAETWFANNVFHPVIKSGLTLISYDDHLYYFITSLLWRALNVEVEKEAYRTEFYYDNMIACMKQWRSFLNDGYVPHQFQKVYMMALHPDQMDIPNLRGTQYYLMRNLDMTIVTNNTGCSYVYAKLPRFLFWAPLSSYNSSPANLIDMQGGHFNCFDIPTDRAINGFIPNRIKEVNHLNSQLSPQQKKATLDYIEKDRKGFLASEAGRLFSSRR